MSTMFIGKWNKTHTYVSLFFKMLCEWVIQSLSKYMGGLGSGSPNNFNPTFAHYLLKFNKMKSKFFSKKYTIISLICLFLNIHLIISQTNEQNLEKYWHYRYRLTHYFMVVGAGAGESLPADIRNLYNGGTLKWSESLVQLGYYLGVLATEYHLLKKNNQNTDQTLTELYYALNALKRLDYAADGAENGYLIDDDVDPYSFRINHQTELNNSIALTNYIPNSGEVCKIDTIQSDRSAASQDMLYNLLMGLALVNKYVDDGAAGTYFHDYISNSSGLFNFQIYTKSCVHSIVSYIQNSPFPSTFLGTHWQLTTPGGAISNGNGGNAKFFSYGVAQAGKFITGGDYTAHHPLFWESRWQNFQNHEALRFNFSNTTLSSILAAIGDSWTDSDGNNTTKAGIYFNGDYGASILGLWKSNYHGNEVFYGAIHRLLHGYSLYDAPAINMCKMLDMLKTAPRYGTYCHSPGDRALNDWAASRRFYNEPPDQDIGQNPPGPDFEGNYNGLDYMLLHNLYYCLQEGQFYISKIMPNNWDMYGHPGIKYYIGAPYQAYAQYSKIIIQNTIIHEDFGTLYGAAIITGGPQGVEVSNTEVTEGAELTITTDNSCGGIPEEYVFNTLYYKNLEASNDAENDSLPQYKMIPEPERQESLNLVVLPNPNNGTFKVRLTKNNQAIGVKEIKVFNILGEVIWETGASENSVFTIDITSYPQGIYYIEAESEQGEIELKKIIKQ